jgi:hypothetical protein
MREKERRQLKQGKGGYQVRQVSVRSSLPEQNVCKKEDEGNKKGG